MPFERCNKQALFISLTPTKHKLSFTWHSNSTAREVQVNIMAFKYAVVYEYLWSVQNKI